LDGRWGLKKLGQTVVDGVRKVDRKVTVVGQVLQEEEPRFKSDG
jgi:hypothetical protein